MGSSTMGLAAPTDDVGPDHAVLQTALQRPTVVADAGKDIRQRSLNSSEPKLGTIGQRTAGGFTGPVRAGEIRQRSDLIFVALGGCTPAAHRHRCALR